MAMVVTGVAGSPRASAGQGAAPSPRSQAADSSRPARGKAMVDRVLAAMPQYPEALSVRGLINLMGLRQARPSERDFSAYLAAAPFGSHRAAAATLLALAQSQARR